MIYSPSSSSSGRGTASAYFCESASVLERTPNQRKTYGGQFLFVHLHQSWINCDLGGCQGGGGNELEGRVSLIVKMGSIFTSRVRGNEDLPNKFPRQPEERFFEVVVRLGRNLEVLNILLSVESHSTGLHFSLLQKLSSVDSRPEEDMKVP